MQFSSCEPCTFPVCVYHYLEAVPNLILTNSCCMYCFRPFASSSLSHGCSFGHLKVCLKVVVKTVPIWPQERWASTLEQHPRSRVLSCVKEQSDSNIPSVVYYLLCLISPPPDVWAGDTIVWDTIAFIFVIFVSPWARSVALLVAVKFTFGESDHGHKMPNMKKRT